jgi:hypothetical protein
MPKTPAEICADKVVAEVKRLCPPAKIRISQEAFGDRGADIYIYVPRKYTDMLRQKANAAKVAAIKATNAEADKIRVFLDAEETMTEKAKAYFANQAPGGAPAGAPQQAKP